MSDSKDAPLSQKAIDFMAKVYKCEPPCDSYGLCSNCCEAVDFQAGYNFGYKAHIVELERQEFFNKILTDEELQLAAEEQKLLINPIDFATWEEIMKGEE